MALTNFDLWRLEGITSMPCKFGPEGASKTHLRGAPLVYSSGNLQEAGADPTTVVGVAAHAGRNVAAGARSFFIPPEENVVFVGSLDTSAGEGTGTVAATDLGVEYGITKSAQAGATTLNKWYVDKNKTGGSARVKVVELIDAAATVQGRVGFIFLATAKT